MANVVLREQLRNGDVEGFGELLDGSERDVVLGALDGPDEGAVLIGEFGEDFLRPAADVAGEAPGGVGGL